MMKFIHVIEYLHKKIAFCNVFHSGIYSLHFVQMPDGLNVGPTPKFDKIGHMVNSLVNVIHSHPNLNKSMTCCCTYLRENNISIYLKTLKGAFQDHYDKSIDCE